MGANRGELAEAVDAAFADSRAVGAAVAVSLQDERWFETRGVLSVDDGRAVTAQTPFQLGSVAKAFTALALARLADDGRLDLDAPVRHYLTGFSVGDEGAAAAVTPRHLLTHTAGWEGDFCRDTGQGDDALSRAVEAMAGLPQLHAPGAMWSYCNSAYYVAARLVEVLAGEPFAAALERLVCAPLELGATAFERTRFGDAVAVGHVLGQAGPELSDTWGLPRAMQGIAGVAATAEDLLDFARFHMGSGEPLLGAEGLDELLRPVDGLPRGTPRQALAWRVERQGEVEVVNISGSSSSQGGLIAIVPAAGFACVAMANTNTAGAFTERVKRAALRLIGVSQDEPPAVADADRMRACTGHYENPTHDVVLALDGEQLTAQITFKRGGFPWNTVEEERPLPALPCTLYDDGRLRVLPDTPFERPGRVVAGDHDEPQWVILHGRAHRREA